MKELLKQIRETEVEFKFSLDRLNKLEDVLEKYWELKDGIPTEDGCKCPVCGANLVKGGHYCPTCGQWVKYVESDILPL